MTARNYCMRIGYPLPNEYIGPCAIEGASDTENNPNNDFQRNCFIAFCLFVCGSSPETPEPVTRSLEEEATRKRGKFFRMRSGTFSAASPPFVTAVAEFNERGVQEIGGISESPNTKKTTLLREVSQQQWSSFVYISLVSVLIRDVFCCRCMCVNALGCGSVRVKFAGNGEEMWDLAGVKMRYIIGSR